VGNFILEFDLFKINLKKLKSNGYEIIIERNLNKKGGHFIISRLVKYITSEEITIFKGEKKNSE